MNATPTRYQELMEALEVTFERDKERFLAQRHALDVVDLLPEERREFERRILHPFRRRMTGLRDRRPVRPQVCRCGGTLAGRW